MKGNEQYLTPEELQLTEELLRQSFCRMQAQAHAGLAERHRAVCRRGDRRHFRAFALLMLALMTVTGLLVAHRYPYVMKVPAGTDREFVNLYANQLIALI